MKAKCTNHQDAEIGGRIRSLRVLAGMTQEKLAEILGITFQQVQKYEKGVNRVSGSRILAIASALGVSPTQLLTGEGESAHQIAASFGGAEISIADAGAIRQLFELPIHDRRRVGQLIQALHSANFQLQAAE